MSHDVSHTVLTSQRNVEAVAIKVNQSNSNGRRDKKTGRRHRKISSSAVLKSTLKLMCGTKIISGAKALLG